MKNKNVGLECLPSEILEEVLGWVNGEDLVTLSCVSRGLGVSVSQWKEHVRSLTLGEGFGMREESLKDFPVLKELRGMVVMRDRGEDETCALVRLHDLSSRFSGFFGVYWPGAVADIRSPVPYMAENLVREIVDAAVLLAIVEERVKAYPQSDITIVLSRLYRVEYRASSSSLIFLVPQYEDLGTHRSRNTTCQMARLKRTPLTSSLLDSTRDNTNLTSVLALCRFLSSVPLRSFAHVDTSLDSHGCVLYLSGLTSNHISQTLFADTTVFPDTPIRTLGLPRPRRSNRAGNLLLYLPYTRNIDSLYFFDFEPLDAKGPPSHGPIGSPLHRANDLPFERFPPFDPFERFPPFAVTDTLECSINAIIPERHKARIRSITGPEGTPIFVDENFETTYFKSWHPDLMWNMVFTGSKEDMEHKAAIHIIKHNLKNVLFHDTKGERLYIEHKNLIATAIAVLTVYSLSIIALTNQEKKEEERRRQEQRDRYLPWPRGPSNW